MKKKIQTILHLAEVALDTPYSSALVDNIFSNIMFYIEKSIGDIKHFKFIDHKCNFKDDSR